MLKISQSRLKSWRRCHQAHDYAWNQHLQKKAKPLPMLRGTILHELLDAQATGKLPEDVIKKFGKQYRILFIEEREIYGTLLEDCWTIFKGYLAQYEGDGLTVVHSEVELSVELDPGVVFLAHLDKVVRDREGRLWIKDHKSHKNIPTAEQRMSDLQTLLYLWAWNVTQREQAAGILWDYIRAKPPTIPQVLKNGQLSQSKNISTDRATYLRTIREHKLNPVDYQEMLDYLEGEPNKFFERVPLPVSQQMVDKVVADAKMTATEIGYLGTTLTDKNLTKDCSYCMFYNLCQADLRGQDVEFIKKAEYIVEERYGNEESSDD